MAEFTTPRAAESSDRWHAVTAGFLGWTLDAFDFFVVIFLFDTLAQHFHVSKADIILSVTGTLAMRPIGALIFGMLADRYGRRRPLMANVIFFSAVEVLCGFAPNFTVFFILRLLFGIGMGGEWGVGASLAMEHAPVGMARRSLRHSSERLSVGIPAGCRRSPRHSARARVARDVLGWRLPALLALYIRTKVPESEAWQQHRMVAKAIDGPKIAMQHKRLVLYMVALMFLMNCLSHGTQDLYPDFLKHGHAVAPNTVAYITMFYNVGAVTGAMIFGLAVGAHRPPLQHVVCTRTVAADHAGVGVWRNAHRFSSRSLRDADGRSGRMGNHSRTSQRTVASPVRGLLPGFTYQIGILLAASTPTVEFALRDRLGYPWALTSFELVVIAGLALLLIFGRENHGKSFLRDDAH